jgi:type IV pilus assembly protein PilO
MSLGSLSIPKKYRLPLIAILGIGIIVAGYFLCLKPQFEEKDRVVSEKEKVQRELARLKVIKNNIERSRTEYAQLKAKLNNALSQMPEQKDIPNLLRQVSLIAGESKTKVKYFAPKSLQNAEFYQELPFELKFSAPYHNLGYFFDGIRKLERIVHITSFAFEAKVSGQKVILEGNCNAKAYVLLKQTASGSTKATKKDNKDEKK